MMHMSAHCAHSVPGALQAHMHIYPLGYVHCVNPIECTKHKQRRVLANTITSRVGDVHG